MKCPARISVMILAIRVVAGIFLGDHDDPILIERWLGSPDLHTRSFQWKSQDSSSMDDSIMLSYPSAPTTNVAFGSGRSDTTKADYLRGQRWENTLVETDKTGSMSLPKYMMHTTSSLNKYMEPRKVKEKDAKAPSKPEGGRGGTSATFIGQPNYLRDTVSSYNRKSLVRSSSITENSSIREPPGQMKPGTRNSASGTPWNRSSTSVRPGSELSGRRRESKYP